MTQASVLFGSALTGALVFFFPPFVSVLTPFFRVYFQVRGAHLIDTETHVDAHAGAQQGGGGAFSHVPGVADLCGVTSRSAVTDCGLRGVPLCWPAVPSAHPPPGRANESRACSGSETQRPRRRRFEEENVGGSKLGSRTVSERVCGEESELVSVR